VKRVEIVAPVYNRRETTLLCLRSLSRINSEGLDVHIIIVDDASSDKTSESIASEFPDVQIIQGDGNLWFTEGTNVGVRAALEYNPDYILMMNDDQVFDADFLHFMIETAEKHPHSIVGALLLLWDTPHKVFQVSPKWETMSGGWRHWQHQTVWTVPEKPWLVEIIVGNCVLFPASAIKEVGLMDSKRYPNFGDAEYTPRLRKKGWKLLIDPRARVFCQPNNIPKSVTKMTYKDKLDALFFNSGNGHNLKRRFHSNVDGAPTKFQGVIAFGAFLIRAFLRRSYESSWAVGQSEKEIRKTFELFVVKD